MTKRVFKSIKWGLSILSIFSTVLIVALLEGMR